MAAPHRPNDSEAETSGFEFDIDTALTAIDGARFACEVTDRWGIYGNPNGGYLAALTTRAIGRAVPQPDPFSVTTHYLSVPRPGLAEVIVEVVRTGRGHSTAVARLVQGSDERLRTIATFGDLAKIEGPTIETGRPLAIPPVEGCEAIAGTPPGSSFGERVEARFAPEYGLSFLRGELNGVMEIAGYLRFVDGRPPDPLSLVLFADAMPPPSLNAVQRGWVPTIELTVHVRRRPRAGWLRAQFRTRYVIDGYLEEDGELWDSEGRLVAMSRQLARIQRA